MTARDAAARAEIRAFARANHPDRGGDPEVFATGLAALRARQRKRDEQRDDPRYDAPVVVVQRPRLRRLTNRLCLLANRLRRHPRVR
ncbi:hypothetical protein [Saccharopolyspora taberi]|uniref:J domain-containing protein n=1 Tax=Saccharopolyspora taberi TaxID=60895 RepID=A0ABN3VGK5_9PSEU